MRRGQRASVSPWPGPNEIVTAARVGGYCAESPAPDNLVRRLWQEDGDRRLRRVDQWPWKDAEDQRTGNHQDEGYR